MEENKLQEILDVVTYLKQHSATKEELKSELALSRQELTAEFQTGINGIRQELTTEFQTGINGLRQELTTEFQTGINGLRRELTTEFQTSINGLRNELTTKISSVRDELSSEMDSLRGDIKLQIDDLATKDDVRGMIFEAKNELLSHIDGLAEMHKKLDVEYVSLRSKTGRHDDQIETIYKHLNLVLVN